MVPEIEWLKEISSSIAYEIAIPVSILSSIGMCLSAEMFIKMKIRMLPYLGLTAIFVLSGLQLAIKLHGSNIGVILISLAVEMIAGYLLVLLMKFVTIYYGICSYEDIWEDRDG